ncbi:hypothetical protein LG634_01625 [Streptomyces bambusae]|uniref:hypothetical protein n=1 Tax=Streptomyces bambusae TaxID=1550616 RepID=UPI001CFE190C|nr:hypothetical protein [Streptomyces bambusae]MCB5163549.1 hypothetical protein [Streptomyces bambusae]
MATSTLLAIVIPVAVVLIAAGVALWLLRRRRALRERFGPEYERTVADEGSKRAADSELRQREERHEHLDIRELPADRRHRYEEDWITVQQRFVDDPKAAVDSADGLLTHLMQDRGYPTRGYEDQLRELSVEHGRTLEHYRAAHEVNERSGEGRATTEELRGAMVHYRALFDELIGTR